MKIISVYENGIAERVYCPSTKEVVYEEYKGPDFDAQALIGLWCNSWGEKDVVIINDDQLDDAWNQYLITNGQINKKTMDAFFEGHENPSLIVFRWEYNESYPGNTKYVLYLAVKADSIIEPVLDRR